MKLLKKIILAILMTVLMLFVTPVIFQVHDIGYTVEAATIKINKTKYTMCKGTTYTLKISGTKKKVTWKTSNSKIATVKKGKVTAKKKGTVTISAKVSGKTYKCKITVEEPKISITKYTMNVGKKYTLKLTGTKQKVAWSTSNSKVATVSSKGKVTAKKAGKATITAKVNGKKYKCQITVKATLKQDILENLSMKMIIPHNGTYNNYASLKVVNLTNYDVKINYVCFFNGYSCNGITWGDSITDKFELKKGYQITLDYYRAFSKLKMFDKKYNDMYLDKDSTGEVGFEVNGKAYWAYFDTTGKISLK